ncbi:MAG: Rrf2 family transcriptional regulator [Alphaproteobacteria bacterium]|nr:Rrf2 family transcriptional regulator [Alphaproteobacteria bacterium]
MQLTQFTDYGLRSLMYLASQPDRLCSVREIAEHYAISRNHLVKVVHRLAQLGYITSSKGKGGGIRLACKLQELRLGDLVLALEPNMHLVECFNRETNTCTVVSACKLKHFLADASKAFIESLNRHTLADAVVDNKLLQKRAP